MSLTKKQKAIVDDTIENDLEGFVVNIVGMGADEPVAVGDKIVKASDVQEYLKEKGLITDGSNDLDGGDVPSGNNDSSDTGDTASDDAEGGNAINTAGDGHTLANDNDADEKLTPEEEARKAAAEADSEANQNAYGNQVRFGVAKTPSK